MPIDLTALPATLVSRIAEWPATTTSTMTRAAELARTGAAHGTIVGADEQAAGQGRHGRRWHSESGAGLYVSFVLRLQLKPESLPVAMLALGLAAKDAITKCTALQPDLRWPNDVLIDGRKCAGVLAQWEDATIIAGIGINVTQTTFPDGLETPATSLKLSGAKVSRETLLAALADSVDYYCYQLERDEARILEEFETRSTYARGRRVQVDLREGRVEGTTIGLDPTGFLIVREDSGKETTILAGGVRAL